MSLEEAIELLKKKYEEAKDLSFVVNPISYALYQVWREVERRDERHY